MGRHDVDLFVGHAELGCDGVDLTPRNALMAASRDMLSGDKFGGGASTVDGATPDEAEDTTPSMGAGMATTESCLLAAFAGGAAGVVDGADIDSAARHQTALAHGRSSQAMVGL